MNTPKHQHIVVKVKGKNDLYVFRIAAFVATEEKELLLEKDFYKSGIPPFPHIEMCLLNHAEWKGPYHIHTSVKTGGKFVCWPSATPDYDAVRRVLRIWATGTVFTKESGRFLGDAMSKFGNDFERTVKYFETDYGITITSMEFSDISPLHKAVREFLY